MAKRDSNAVWVEMDVASLSEAQARAYEMYKASYRAMKEHRTEFETAMQEGVPEGKRIVCGYNFGKLSVALVDDDRKPVKAQAAKQSLAEFLAAQVASGRNA